MSCKSFTRLKDTASGDWAAPMLGNWTVMRVGNKTLSLVILSSPFELIDAWKRRPQPEPSDKVTPVATLKKERVSDGTRHAELTGKFLQVLPVAYGDC